MNNYQWLLQMDGADRKAWFDAEHVETKERALDGDTEPENEDSRDKLGADAKRYIEYAACDARTDVLWAEETLTLLDAVIELLDRQAAITEREICKWWRDEEAKHDERIHRISELQRQCDELNSRVERTCHIEYPCYGDAPVINGQPRCSECKTEFAVGTFPHYCPNCGAKVKDVDE